MYIERETGCTIIEAKDVFAYDEYDRPILWGDSYYDLGDVLIHEDNIDEWLWYYKRTAQK